MATHSSTLAWKILWTEEPRRLQSQRVTKSRTRLTDFTSSLNQVCVKEETEWMCDFNILWLLFDPELLHCGGLESLMMLWRKINLQIHKVQTVCILYVHEGYHLIHQEKQWILHRDQTKSWVHSTRPVSSFLCHRLSVGMLVVLCFHTSDFISNNITDSMDMSLGKLWVGDGQGGLVCCSPWGCKESDTTEQLNWTEPMMGIRIHSGDSIFVPHQHQNQPQALKRGMSGRQSW